MNVKKLIALVVGLGAIMVGVGFLIIQLAPVDKSNPPVVSEPQWDSPQTRALADRACFDCHSNETRWPWYSNVAPVSWMIASEVREGREHLNYSNWRPDEENESIEAVLSGEMPPRQYLLMHPEARLTEAEQATLIAGLRRTFGPGENEGDEIGERDDDGQNQHNNDDDRHEDDDDGRKVDDD